MTNDNKRLVIGSLGFGLGALVGALLTRRSSAKLRELEDLLRKVGKRQKDGAGDSPVIITDAGNIFKRTDADKVLEMDAQQGFTEIPGGVIILTATPAIQIYLDRVLFGPQHLTGDWELRVHKKHEKLSISSLVGLTGIKIFSSNTLEKPSTTQRILRDFQADLKHGIELVGTAHSKDSADELRICFETTCGI